MGGEAPDWEAEFWSYIGKGDGLHCPLYDHCEARLAGSLCGDECRETVNQLLYSEEFNTSSPPLPKCSTPSRLCRLIERLAQKYLSAGDIHTPPVPTGLVALADPRHTIEVRTIPLKVYHGAIWHLDGRWVIQTNENDPPAVRRLTIFHEAFHILAHSKTRPVFRKRGGEEGAFNELLADCFALCVLIPAQWVENKWAELEDVDRMAEMFDVPGQAMRFRLMSMGLIP